MKILGQNAIYFTLITFFVYYSNINNILYFNYYSIKSNS